MTLLTPQGQKALQRDEVRNLIAITVGAAAISAASGVYLASHIDPTLQINKEVRLAIGFSVLSTLASLGYKVYKAEKNAGYRD
jgi:hypothetical protein